MRHAVTIATTFLSAFLLFMVQLMLGKRILPWFGGTPAVWTTCMLFFQVALLVGYAYAHGLAERLRLRHQALLHVALCGLAVAWLALWAQRWGVPLLADDSWKPAAGDDPQARILWLLLIGVGLPFIVLSTTSPLLQKWHSLAGHGESSYRLYAVSNIGSLLGLVSYPFLVERVLPLAAQAWAWSVGFLVVCGGTAALAWWTARGRAGAPELPPAESPAERVPVDRIDLLAWLLLATGTSAMLLAVTNELCQEVAAVPFLWMLPLVLYLLSFVICFDRPQWYQRRWFVPLTLVATLVVIVTAALGLRLKVPVQIASFSAFLFLLCMTCHGELVGLKPPAGRLTLFYLIVALGGALGGVFVGLIAPRIFDSYWEFNIMVTLIWVVLAVIYLRDKSSLFHRGDWRHFGLAVWLLCFTGLRAAMFFGGWNPGGTGAAALAIAAVLTAVPAVAAVLWLRHSGFARHWLWPRLTVAAVIFLAECFMVVRIRSTGTHSLAAERNFFGTLRVQVVPPAGKETRPYLQLTHGQINHGIQYVDGELRRQPVSYYGPESGIDLAVRRHPQRLAGKPLHIGVLGLGVGTMAAFAETGERVRFYEINPTVIRWATGKNAFFSYLADSAGAVEIVEGDARLSLERELAQGAAQQFDLLVMDAFSSDSVPVHLLTRQAFQLYAKHLRDDESILAINVSNRFLDFSSLVANQALDLGFQPWVVVVVKPAPGRSQSMWMLLSRSPGFGEDPEVGRLARLLPPRDPVRWTDDFSPLYPLLR